METFEQPMTLTLYIHPLASFCHKVLIALYETGTTFETQIVNFADTGSAAALLDKWPVGKIPVLYDAGTDQTLPETSIIIEYLQLHRPGTVPLLPDDVEQQLQVRLWDRFFDLYVSVPMQKIVTDRIRPEGSSDPYGVAEARAMLDQAYGMIETHMSNRLWAAGDTFTMADCAGLPALFFASVVHPFAPEQRQTRAYFERLLQRPSVRRVLREAQPHFSMFPYRDAMPTRYFEPW